MEVALGRGVAAALAVTVCAFAAGSTIVGPILLAGRPARWACLGALLALSVAYAAVARRGGTPALAWLAGLLVAVAFASAFWSIDPPLTLRRAASLAVLLAVGACLLAATRGRTQAVERLLAGLLAGSVAVALAGLVLLAVDHDSAIQPSSTDYPSRYRGFEQNPNTAAMLLAVATPLALLVLLQDGRTRKLAAAAVLLLFAGSLAASGARGPMLAALVGAVVFFAVRGGNRRRTLALVGASAAVFAAALAISRIPQPAPLPPGKPRPPHSVPRTLFTSSGRSAAWRESLREVERRPLAGYGFGTEELAFVSRNPSVVFDLPENSYIGALLQLGVIGLVLLLVVVASAFVRLTQRQGRPPPAAAACAGAIAAGLTVAVTQSYLFSVGNVATATVWICLFLLVAATDQAVTVAASSSRMRSSDSSGSHSG